MACKFRADHMTQLSFACIAALLAATAVVLPVAAEKADRTKPMVVEGDRSGNVDLQKQVYQLTGNATVTQGTMVIRADRIEVREQPDGFRLAVAIGSAGNRASYRQRRDGPGDEIVEGTADRIEYDSKAGTLRFVGAAIVKRLRAGTTAEEITGPLIVWNNVEELFTVVGGATPASGGRVRAVLTPQPDAAASAPAPAASAVLQPTRPTGAPR